MEKISKEAMDQHLSSYFHAEKKGSELIARLVAFAPGEKEKEWISIWSKEEEHHHKLWDAVVQGRNFTPKNIDRNVRKIFEITEDYVNKRHWVGSMVGAAVIEHLSNAAAAYLFHDADDDMKKVFQKITGDDLGHLDFDIHQIKNGLQTKQGTKEVEVIHKRFLSEIMEWPMRKETTDVDIDILNDAYQLHRNAMGKIGLRLPNINFSKNASFKIKRILIKILILRQQVSEGEAD